MATRSNRSHGVSEKAFMAQIIQLARMCGWLVYHPFDSRRSEPGWPDLAMTRPSLGNQPARLVLAELKSDRGKLTPEQIRWLEVLGQVPNVETYCWRPNDWNEIVRVLRPDADVVEPDRLAPLTRNKPGRCDMPRLSISNAAHHGEYFLSGRPSSA